MPPSSVPLLSSRSACSCEPTPVPVDEALIQPPCRPASRADRSRDGETNGAGRAAAARPRALGDGVSHTSGASPWLLPLERTPPVPTSLSMPSVGSEKSPSRESAEAGSSSLLLRSISFPPAPLAGQAADQQLLEVVGADLLARRARAELG